MKYFMSIAVLLMSYAVVANAQNPTIPYKVYGNVWALANNYNDHNNAVKTKFLDGTKPAMKVTFNTDANTIIGYPAIIRGWHYNTNPIPSDKSLPQQVSKLSKIATKFSYTNGGSNLTGDFTYDIFLRTDTSKTKPDLEIMIWADHNSWPIGQGKPNRTNVITVAGRTFDLWEGQNSAADHYVYSFVPHGTVASPGKKKLVSHGSLDADLKVFFDWLQKNKAHDGKYSDSMYLDAVEAGFEILYGDGWVYFTASIDVA